MSPCAHLFPPAILYSSRGYPVKHWLACFFVFGVMLPLLLPAAAAGYWSPRNENNGIPYHVWIPDTYNATQSYAAVLYLHSSGGRGKECHMELCDALSYLVHQGQTIEPHFIIVPLCATDQRWVNVDWDHGSYAINDVPISTPMTGAIGALDDVISAYSIDTGRLYVCGGSMGGYGTWDAVCRFPQRFAAAHPVAGAGDPGRAPLLTSVGIWAFHGKQDWTVPVKGSRDMIEAITTAGGTPRYSELPVGHLWDLQFSRTDPELFEWMFSRTRTTTATAPVLFSPAACLSQHQPLSSSHQQLLLSGRRMPTLRSVHLVLSPLPRLITGTAWLQTKDP